MATDLDSVTVTAGNEIEADERNKFRKDLIRRAGDYETVAGTANALTLSIDAQYVAYKEGDVFTAKIASDSTGSVTLNVNSLGTLAVKDVFGMELLSGALKADDQAIFRHNGTDITLIAPARNLRNLRPYTLNFVNNVLGSVAPGNSGGTGFSDDSTPLHMIGRGGSGAGSVATVKEVTDFGSQLLPIQILEEGSATSAAGYGTCYLNDGSSNTRWISTGASILKNGSGVTVSGATRVGKLGHDVTNSYLLVLYSTTQIARFSGISGTTITNINSDITLDTAVDNTRGFMYDDTNSRYICIDTTNSVIRRFDSSGTTVDTYDISSYDITACDGVCYIGDRVYLTYVFGGTTTNTVADITTLTVTYVPTGMTRE